MMPPESAPKTLPDPEKPAPEPPSEKAPAHASHDLKPPQALVDFMMTGWRARAVKLPAPLPHHEAYRARRRALSELFPGATLVVPTGHEKIRANDTTYRFRPGSDFFYLTGNQEPDCVLALVPQAGGGHLDVLFVEPNPGRSTETFFTDRAKGELWVGARLGVKESRARFAVDEARGLPELKDFLKSLSGSAAPRRVLRGLSAQVDELAGKPDERDQELAQALGEMRELKDALELRELSLAIASTHRAFDDILACIETAEHEREVEGAFAARARLEGNDVGYETIAAAGAHACILHFSKNDGRIPPGSLLLVDAGIEGRSLYTADITRTFPVSGRFTKEQREIYDLVLASQVAGMAEVKPGNDFLAPHRAAMKVLAEGLERLGILEDSAEALQEDKQLYKRYTLHNTSHMLGLDVHDCAQARAETYREGKLKPGMVLTMEPGLYFQVDDLTVPAKYRGIGIRIEDDVLVTERGRRNLSLAIPREAAEVERWIAKAWKARKSGR